MPTLETSKTLSKHLSKKTLQYQCLDVLKLFSEHFYIEFQFLCMLLLQKHQHIKMGTLT